ncbi:MAG: hypothetical protein QXS27_02100 [Candidatus Jordarchaeaceae archaeon]
MSLKKEKDIESLEERTEKIVIDRVIVKEAVAETELLETINKVSLAVAELTAVLGKERVTTDPTILKHYSRDFYIPVKKAAFESVSSTGILVLPATDEEAAECLRIANDYDIPVTTVTSGAKVVFNTTPSIHSAMIMDLRLMGRKISKPADIPPLILRFILERWSELLEPLKHRFVEAGLVGASFTEKSADAPFDRVNYYFDRDGALKFDFESDEDKGKTIITYKDFETGFRSLEDKNFDSMKAFLEGHFKIEPSPEEALKMAPMMPDMIEAHKKAVIDAEKKFNIELPRY